VLHEVEAMTRRILLMDHGRTIADGTVEEIRRDLSDTPSVVRVATERPREVAARLVALDGTARVEVAAGEVLVATLRPDELFSELVRLSVEEGMPIGEFHATDESLEAVFGYLTAPR
jgi:ABC-2 type transport system ATP-binding protein